MICSLLAYDTNGQVIATLDHMVSKDADGNVVGLIDFEAHELAGGRLRDVWDVDGAVGSGTWPEWLGMRAHDFAVELEPGGRAPGYKAIRALIHKQSGHRRERAPVEKAIADRIAALRANPWLAGEPRASHAPTPDAPGQLHGGAVWIGDLVGGPTKPLRLDDQGRTITDPLPAPPELPTISAETFRVRG